MLKELSWSFVGLSLAALVAAPAQPKAHRPSPPEKAPKVLVRPIDFRLRRPLEGATDLVLVPAPREAPPPQVRKAPKVQGLEAHLKF